MDDFDQRTEDRAPEGLPEQPSRILGGLGTIVFLVILGLAVGGAVLGAMEWHEKFWSALVQHFR